MKKDQGRCPTAGGAAAPDERAVEKAAAELEFKQYVVMLIAFLTTVPSSAVENLCSTLEVVWR
jgi:hypothetical protein